MILKFCWNSTSITNEMNLLLDYTCSTTPPIIFHDKSYELFPRYNFSSWIVPTEPIIFVAIVNVSLSLIKDTINSKF